MKDLGNDIRLAIRGLTKRPGYLAMILLTLALGIGVNTAIFALVNGVLITPLPYLEAERLVLLNETRDGDALSVSYPNFLDWRAQSRIFENMASFQFENYNLVGQSGDPERVAGYRVSQGFFDTLGIRPVIGRTFTDRDQGSEGAAVISHVLWQRRFGGTRDVLGKSVRLNDQVFTIVGVMPPKFDFYNGAEIWVPVSFFSADEDLADRNARAGTYVVARFKPGVTMERARSEMASIADRLARAYPEANEGRGIDVIPLFEDTVGTSRRLLLVLLGAVGFVLLIACLNVANLLAVRASGRTREVAIRTALGAHRGRLARQFIIENLVLTTFGGAIGLLLGSWLVRILIAAEPGDIPRLQEVVIDWRVMLYPFAIAVVTGLLFSLVPVLQSWSPDLREQLKAGGEGGSGESGRWQHVRQILVSAQVALSLILLIGSALMLASFLKLISTSPGFNYENVLTLSISLPETKYPETAQAAVFFEQLLERVSPLPGVRSAGVVNPLPLSGGNRSTSILVEGLEPPPGEKGFRTDWAPASPDYFQTMGVPLLRGRFFTAQDRGGPPATAVIVDETLAEQFWPSENPLGKRLRRSNTEPGEWATVVGVVGHVKYYGLQSESRVQMYLPFAQNPISAATLVVKTSSDPLGLIPAIRKEVQKLDPTLPIYSVQPLEDLFADSVAQPRFSSLVLAVFAVTSLLLSVIGIYGMVSYTVSRRTREIGLRMALGAQLRDVRKLVVGQALKPVLLGVVLGLAGSAALTRVIQSLLYGMSPMDIRVFAGVTLLLVLAGVSGSLIPAWRASRVNPTRALKYE